MTDFTWKDGERWILFRRKGLAAAPGLLRERGWKEFELLTTPRAVEAAPAELSSSADVHSVPPGQVPDAAAEIVDHMRGRSIVALGGGRVIDAAKAIAAIRGGRVCAIPTTLVGRPDDRGSTAPVGPPPKRPG